MAKFAYVKSGFGTSTTDTTFTSLQAEAFGGTNLTAANCYGNVVDAITYAALGYGDFICISNLNDEQYTASIIINVPNGVTLVSIDDTNGALYLVGAKISVVSSTDELLYIQIRTVNSDGECMWLYGITFIALNNLYIAYQYGLKSYFQDCTFNLTRAASFSSLYVIHPGSDVTLNNCTVNMSNYQTRIVVSGGAKLTANNLVVNAQLDQENIIVLSGGGGSNVLIDNSDLSNLSLSLGLVRQRYDSDDVANVKVSRCKIANYPIFSIGTPSAIYMDAYSCAVDDDYYYFESQRREGAILRSTAIYRSGGATYDGTNAFSIELQTRSNIVTYTNPLKFKLGIYLLDLTASKTLTFHFVQQDADIIPTNLTDHEVWIDVTSADATDNALGITYSSRTSDVFDVPTDVPTSTETWVSTSINVNKQSVSVTLPANGIANAQVEVYINLAKDITTVDATEFFVCPSPEIT